MRPKADRTRAGPATLDQFPLQAHEKLRYADADRQGHVNNAAFATMLETGRVEVLYNPDRPLAELGCSFVIAHLAVDFLAEVKWPGLSTAAPGSPRSTKLDQALFQDGTCVATATTVIVIVDATGRGQPFSEGSIDFLKHCQAGSN